MNLATVEYHGVTGTFQARTASGGTVYDVGVAKGWSVSLEFDTSELYGQGSTARQKVRRYQMRVPTSIAYASFDGKLLGRIMGKTHTGSDIDLATASGRETNVVPTEVYTDQESYIPNLFRIYGRVTDGTDYFRVRVDNVHFPGFPFEVPTDDFVVISLEGEGDALRIEHAT